MTRWSSRRSQADWSRGDQTADAGTEIQARGSHEDLFSNLPCIVGGTGTRVPEASLTPGSKHASIARKAQYHAGTGGRPDRSQSRQGHRAPARGFGSSGTLDRRVELFPAAGSRLSTGRALSFADSTRAPKRPRVSANSRSFPGGRFIAAKRHPDTIISEPPRRLFSGPDSSLKIATPNP